MRSELTAFWRATSDEDMAQDTIICTDESFTPDLYVMILQLNSVVKLYLLWVKTKQACVWKEGNITKRIVVEEII